MKYFFYFIISSLFFISTTFAQSLSTNVLPAGKSILGKILDSSNNDVTSQYKLSYAGSELKITPFAGKSVLVGSIVGSWNIIATKISDSSVINLPVEVIPGAASNLSILEGNGQSAQTNSIFSNSLRVKVTDSFGNLVPNSQLTFSVTSGSANIGGASVATASTDSNGIASVQLTSGSVAERELINSTILGSGKFVFFSETTTTPPNQAVKMSITTLAPSIVTVGQSLSLSAQAKDSVNNFSASYSGLITVSGYQNNGCTIPSSVPLQGSLIANASAGIVNFTNIKPQAVETLYIKVTGAGLSPICSQLISVSIPVTGLTSLKFTQFPTLLKPNQNLFPALKVAELDNNSQIMSSGTDSIQIIAYDDSGCLQKSAVQLSSSSANVIAGYATFSFLQSTTARTIFIKSFSGTVSSACSAALIIIPVIATPSPTPSPNATPIPTPTPLSCNMNQHIEGNTCVSNTQTCLINNGVGSKIWTGSSYGACSVLSCNNFFHINAAQNSCDNNMQSCFILNGTGSQVWTGAEFSSCGATSCNTTFHLNTNANSCDPDSQTCSVNNGSGTQTWDGTQFGTCSLTSCLSGYSLISGSCYSNCPSGYLRNPTTEECVSPLSVPATINVSLNQRLLVPSKGGLPPYSYQKISGVGTLASGVFISSASGNSTVKVTDSLGSSGIVIIKVIPMDGTIDSSFGSFGELDVSLPFQSTNGLVSLSNNQGETFFVGADSSDPTSFDVVKVDTNGATTQALNLSRVGMINGNIIADTDASGNLYVGIGFYNSNFMQQVAIFKVKRSDLTLDSSFNYQSSFTVIGAIKADASGNLIVTQSTFNGPLDIQKVSNTGAVLQESPGMMNSGNESIAIGSSSVVISSLSRNYNGYGQLQVSEFNPDTLSPINTFGQFGGMTSMAFDSLNAIDTNFATTQIDSQGNIYVTVSESIQDMSPWVIGVAKLDSTGTVINTVTNGFNSSVFNNALTVSSSAMISDRLLMLTGFAGSGGVSSPGLQRLKSDLSLDQTFLPSQTSSNDIHVPGLNPIIATNVSLASSGSILVSGFYEYYSMPTGVVFRFVSSLSNGPIITNAPNSLTFGQTLTFTSSGGNGTNTYSIVSGVGNIDSGSGLYSPGINSNSAPVTIQVTDSGGSSSTVTFNYYRFELSPSSDVGVGPNKTQVFTTTGSPVGAVNLAFKSNNSGGSISGLTYTAGSVLNSTDTVEATDSVGNTFDLQISIKPPPVLSSVAIVPTGSAGYVNTSTYTANLIFSGSPTEVSVTDGLSCTSTNWLPIINNSFSSAVNHFNSSNTVSIKIRSKFGESNCVNASFIHDNILPQITFSLPSTGQGKAPNQLNFSWTFNDSNANTDSNTNAIEVHSYAKITDDIDLCNSANLYSSVINQNSMNTQIVSDGNHNDSLNFAVSSLVDSSLASTIPGDLHNYANGADKFYIGLLVSVTDKAGNKNSVCSPSYFYSVGYSTISRSTLNVSTGMYGSLSESVNNPTVVYNNRAYIMTQDGLYSIGANESSYTSVASYVLPPSIAGLPAPVIFNNKIYFSAQVMLNSSYLNADGLFESDGTTAGTFELNGAVVPTSLSVFGSGLYYGTSLRAAYAGLTKIDLSDHAGLASNGISSSTNLVSVFPSNIGGSLLMNYNNNLYSYNGSATSLVKQINPNGSYLPTSQSLFDVATVNNKMYFSAYDGSTTSPWVTDGTPAGTVSLASGNPALIGTNSIGFTEINGKILFATQAAAPQYYAYDPAKSSMTLLHSFPTSYANNYIRNFVKINEQLAIFLIQSNTGRVQIWQSDGTVAGTTLATGPFSQLNTVPSADGSGIRTIDFTFTLNGSTYIQATFQDSRGTMLIKLDP